MTKKQMSIWLSEDQYDWLKKEKQQTHRSMNQIIRDLIDINREEESNYKPISDNQISNFNDNGKFSIKGGERQC